MPFGSPSRPDEESAPVEPAPVEPQTEIPFELDSQRLQRLIQYFSTQTL
jgi:hypothetical protein